MPLDSSFAFGGYPSDAASVADAYGIPRGLFSSLIDVESGGDPYAVSPAGAIGLTQLMPATADAYGVNPFDPVQNLNGGAAYLSDLFKRFGNWFDALSAYNAGPADLAAGEGYARKVLLGAGMLQGAASTASQLSPAEQAAATSGSGVGAATAGRPGATSGGSGSTWIAYIILLVLIVAAVFYLAR